MVKDDNHKLNCKYTSNSWSNRMPIIMPNEYLGVLCTNGNNEWSLRLIDITTGNLKNVLKFDVDIFRNILVLTADNNNFYGIGHDKNKFGVIVIQKLNVDKSNIRGNHMVKP